ncbi:hypothetical protein [Lactococcus lactis]|uniref:hypothetical protein n=1 Tax=Lactococcus lactis TaxID=1358 RepID=UPI000A6A1C62|nr:hypothetical protein [Lactococcus lactis]
MDEINFKKWLQKNNYSKKMQSDFVSRIKRIEKEIDHCDIDSEYRNDRCVNLLRYFEKNGCNEYMSQIKNCDLPIGKYSMSTYRYTINKYIDFKFDTNNQ